MTQGRLSVAEPPADGVCAAGACVCLAMRLARCANLASAGLKGQRKNSGTRFEIWRKFPRGLSPGFTRGLPPRLPPTWLFPQPLKCALLSVILGTIEVVPFHKAAHFCFRLTLPKPTAAHGTASQPSLLRQMVRCGVSHGNPCHEGTASNDILHDDCRDRRKLRLRESAVKHTGREKNAGGGVSDESGLFSNPVCSRVHKFRAAGLEPGFHRKRCFA